MNIYILLIILGGKEKPMNWYNLERITDHIYLDNGPGNEWIGNTWTEEG